MNKYSDHIQIIFRDIQTITSSDMFRGRIGILSLVISWAMGPGITVISMQDGLPVIYGNMVDFKIHP